MLGQHPGVWESVVLVRADQPDNKRLVAYVVANPPAVLSSREVRSFLKQKLPEYMVPAAFVLLEGLPLMPNGKVDRRALPAPDHISSKLERAFVAPRIPAEEAVAGIWAEVLGLKRVGIHDNFFDLGGHSLLATQIMSRVRNTFHVELSLRTLFDKPTIEAFAEVITLSQTKGTR